MKMTVLIENEAPSDYRGLTAEFGLSILFEMARTKILFDTGDTGVFADNAERLGLDLAEVDLAVLSHQHYDHGGGLARFFELNHHAKVYLRQAEHAERCSIHPDGMRPIGLDLGLFDRFGKRFVEINETTEVSRGVTLIVEASSIHPRPPGNRRLLVERNGQLEEDEFDHELTMVLHDAKGMAVVTGCSHRGVLNMIDAAVVHFPGHKVRAVVGGFHLIGLPSPNSMALGRGEVEEIGRAIRRRCEGPIYTGHCTGVSAFEVLQGVLGEQLQPLSTGTSAGL